MTKVLISDKISESAIQVFKNNKIEVDYKPGITEDELNQIASDAANAAAKSAPLNMISRDTAAAVTHSCSNGPQLGNSQSKSSFDNGWNKLETPIDSKLPGSRSLIAASRTSSAVTPTNDTGSVDA